MGLMKNEEVKKNQAYSFHTGVISIAYTDFHHIKICY